MEPNKLRNLLLVLLASFSALCFTVPAYAQDAPAPDAPAESADAPDPEADPIGFASEVISAVKSGNWRLLAALLLVGLMVVLGKVRSKVKWFTGDRGGAVLVMVLAMAGAVSTALMTDATMNWQLFLGAAGVAWTAAGGYTWFKRVIWPSDSSE